MNIHNQIKQLSDRELLEGIYQMLLVVMQEQLISDSKQLGINVIADFYNSFGFDSIPTKQNDGFTEQDLIDYVLENLITK